MGTTPVGFLDGTVPERANDPATIAIPRLPQSVNGTGSFRRDLTNVAGCLAKGAPFNSRVTVTNRDNSRSVQCINNVGGIHTRRRCRAARRRVLTDRRPHRRPDRRADHLVTHSRTRIHELLGSAGLAPRRDLGQNFVGDPNTVRRIAKLAEVGPGDQVVEIGAGLGSLTLALAETGAHVTAVEVDRGIVPVLRSVVDEIPNVTVVEADAIVVRLVGDPRFAHRMDAGRQPALQRGDPTGVRPAR